MPQGRRVSRRAGRGAGDRSAASLGPADDWDGAGGGETYSFPGPGEYLVKLSLQGFRTVWVKVVVTPSAKRDVVDVDTELEEID